MSKEERELCGRVIQVSEEHEYFVTGDDGFVCFWPTNIGAFTAQNLRDLAGELDRRNEGIQRDLKEYFEN